VGRLDGRGLIARATSEAHSRRISPRQQPGVEEGVGIQALIAGRGEAAPSQVLPEFGRLAQDGRGERIVCQLARQIISPCQPRPSAASDQLASHLVVGDLRDDHEDPGEPNCIEPATTGIAERMTAMAARQPEGRAIEQDDPRHGLGSITSFEGRGAALASTLFVDTA
jgi:hypothetical protein